DLPGDRHLADAHRRARREHAGGPEPRGARGAPRADRGRAHLEVRGAPARGAHAPGRARDRALPRDQYAGPRRHRARQHEHRADGRGALDLEAGMLLLHQPDASRGRDARHAGRLPGALGRAARHGHDRAFLHVLRASGGRVVIVVDAFKAVFWSFLGVRRRADYEADTQRLKPQHVIAAGIVVAAVLVLALFMLVKWITR